MNIDFHYGVIYVVARLAGLSKADSTTVAHACQYIDDSTVDGVLNFRDGERFERFASAHEMFDFHNTDQNRNKLVWSPFHFLPAGIGDTLEQRAICKPNSEISQDMMKRALQHCVDKHDNALHRLGVSLHVYVDTWAHQNFCGIKSDYNRVHDIHIEETPLEGYVQKVQHHLNEWVSNIEADVLDLFPLGHGAALHYPDLPWIRWSYRNGKNELIERDNLTEFMEAANFAHRALRSYVLGDIEFIPKESMTVEAQAALREFLSTNTSDDVNERLQRLSEAVRSGTIPGIQAGEEIPSYIPKGNGSWKHIATGITAVNDDGDVEPVYTDDFENSDYRKFHDAVKEHRFEVTQRILPEHHLRLV